MDGQDRRLMLLRVRYIILRTSRCKSYEIIYQFVSDQRPSKDTACLLLTHYGQVVPYET